jgi:hypothetical protein
VDVPLGAEDARRQLDHSFGAHENAPRRVVMIATAAHWQVDSQRDAVSERQFDLRGTAAGTQHTNFGQDFSPRSHDGHRLFRREESVLIQILLHFELSPLAEQNFQVFRRQMHVPGGNVHHQWIRLEPDASGGGEMSDKHVAYDAFDVAPIVHGRSGKLGHDSNLCDRQRDSSSGQQTLPFFRKARIDHDPVDAVECAQVREC